MYYDNMPSNNKGESLVSIYFSTIMAPYFRCLLQSCGVFLKSVIVCNFDTCVSALRFGSAANEALAAYESIFDVFRGWVVLFRVTASSMLLSILQSMDSYHSI